MTSNLFYKWQTVGTRNRASTNASFFQNRKYLEFATILDDLALGAYPGERFESAHTQT
jgi:hypothetical protein